MALRIRPEDYQRHQEFKEKYKLIEPPGVYLFKVKHHEQKKSSKGDSFNEVVTFVGQEGPAQGVEVTQYFNEKAPGIAIPFFEAFGVDCSKGLNPDWPATIGKMVRLEIVHNMYNSQLRNNISRYYPAETEGEEF